MPEALELGTRRRIFEHVRRFPGTHFREILRALELQPGELEYHLHTLEKARLLSGQDEGGRRRYFVSAEIAYPDHALLGLLRQAAVRRILLQLLSRPGLTFQDLLGSVGGAKSTLSFHLKKVTSSGLVTADRSNRERAYRVQEPERLANLLVTYRASFLDAAVDRFVELWLGLEGP